MADNNSVNQTMVAAALNLVQAVYTLNNTDSAGSTALTASLAAINTTLASAFPPALTGSAVYNPPSIANGAQTTTTVTVTGAALGNWADVSYSLDQAGLTFSAYVSSANTVTVIISNTSGGAIDLGSGTLKVRVFTH